jgi:hypothetical protein
MAPCIPERDCWRFLGTYCLIFCSEDGEVSFLRAVADYLIYHTTSTDGSMNLPCCCEKDHILDYFGEGVWNSKYDSGHRIICVVSRLWAERSRVKISAGERGSLLQIVQNGSRAHPASYSMGTGVSYGGKCSWSVMLTTHFNLASRLGIRGDKRLLSTYSWRRKGLIFYS